MPGPIAASVPATASTPRSTMPPASPFYPGKGITPITNPALDPLRPISVSWRTTFLGSRSGEQENNTQRAVASLQGSAGNWDYDAGLLWSNAKVENDFLNGYPLVLGERLTSAPAAATTQAKASATDTVLRYTEAATATPSTPTTTASDTIAGMCATSSSSSLSP